MLDAISILLAVVIGWLLVQVFDPVRNLQPRWAATLFSIALGAGLGMGLTSIVFLLLTIAGAANPATIFGTDLVLIAGLAWRWRTIRDRASSTSEGATTPGFRWTWLLALAFGTVALIAWIRLVEVSAALPVGSWDAWAIWNLRAKFLAGPAGAWRYALSPLLTNSHPDYPLLLSAFVARVWKASGNLDTIAPATTSLLFFAALLGVLVSAVTLLRGAASALLAGLVILSTTSLLIWAPAQYADIPLAFYYLGAIALLFLAAATQASIGRALFCAGLCASFAAWTKNEGIVFLACVPLVYLVITLWRRGMGALRQHAGWLLAGVVPGVVLNVWFKFFLAPAVDPLVTQGASGLTRLHDLSRYSQVAGGFFQNLLNLGSGLGHPFVLLAVLAILLRWQMEERYQLPSLIASAILTLVFLSYCFVFLITPYGLEWQVGSSFDRLMLQVWPSALLVFFVQLRSVSDPASSPASVKTSIARKSPVRSNKLASAGPKAK